MDIFKTIFMWPSDMTAMKARLLSDLQGTDSSIRNCSALDQATRASWGNFYIQSVDFANSDTGIFFQGQIDQAQETAAQLYAWQQKVSRVCALVLPPGDPNNPIPKPVDPTTAAIIKAVEFTSVAVAVVGGAYMIGKLIALVPLPKPKGG